MIGLQQHRECGCRSDERISITKKLTLLGAAAGESKKDTSRQPGTLMTRL